MTLSSRLNEPQRLRRVVIKQELVILTGHWRPALILNQLLYWLERHLDFDRFIAEEQGRQPDVTIELTYGWIYKSSKELIGELMIDVANSTLRRDLQALVERGWVAERTNPRQKWDREKQYRPDLRAIQRDLQILGYALEGYPLLDETTESPLPDACSTTHNAFSMMKNASSTTHNASSIAHDQSCTIEHRSAADAQSIFDGAGAIPETTLETTSETPIETTTTHASDLESIVAVLMSLGLTAHQAVQATERHHLTAAEAEQWRDWVHRLDPTKTKPTAILAAAIKEQRLPPPPRGAPARIELEPASVALPPTDAADTDVALSAGHETVQCVTLPALWTSVLSNLQTDVPASDFQTWLAPTALLELNARAAIVGTPNVFVRQELEARYRDRLTAEVERVVGQRLAVEVVIGTPPPVEARV